MRQRERDSQPVIQCIEHDAAKATALWNLNAGYHCYGGIHCTDIGSQDEDIQLLLEKIKKVDTSVGEKNVSTFYLRHNYIAEING